MPKTTQTRYMGGRVFQEASELLAFLDEGKSLPEQDSI